MEEFIHSKPLFAAISEKFDVHRAMSISNETSPDLALHLWKKMVTLSPKPGTDLLVLRVYAFDPADAQSISELVLEESAQLIDSISLEAEQAVLSAAQKRVSQTRSALNAHQQEMRRFLQDNGFTSGIDYGSEVIPALRLNLARAQVDRAALGQASEKSEAQSLDRRIAAIRWQIDRIDTDLLQALDLSNKHQGLEHDLTALRGAYSAALIGKEDARIQAGLQKRVLKVHVTPTFSSGSSYPDRLSSMLVALGCLFAFWSVFVLFIHNIEDRS